jgi:hypothetical protein
VNRGQRWSRSSAVRRRAPAERPSSHRKNSEGKTAKEKQRRKNKEKQGKTCHTVVQAYLMMTSGV